jgi:hypothetical protein
MPPDQGTKTDLTALPPDFDHEHEDCDQTAPPAENGEKAS